uniref:Uncharacterized protein n=1 Tax=Nelumbo nucifera TaxID=4432 RepID=A0A822ZLQ1_NELNU|nr:TPA_asm: hypothetical protein HUJ06_002549 [Nelumbo nucifera]
MMETYDEMQLEIGNDQPSGDYAMTGAELEEEGGLGYNVGGDSFDVDDDAEDDGASTPAACTIFFG